MNLRSIIKIFARICKVRARIMDIHYVLSRVDLRFFLVGANLLEKVLKYLLWKKVFKYVQFERKYFLF